jgi:Uma2 family endonuclease
MGVPPTQQENNSTQERPWPPEQGQWTYEDWLQLPDDGYRYEVIDGVLYLIPPPQMQHQRVSARLVKHLIEFLNSRPMGEVLFAPVGVRLPNQPVPFQPDILFIRKEQLDIISEDYVEGAPDLVIEILSPSNWLYDRHEKKKVYQEGGVAEYWIVDPGTKTIEVYRLGGGSYLLAGQYGLGEVAQSPGLPGFEVTVDEILRDTPPAE